MAICLAADKRGAARDSGLKLEMVTFLLNVHLAYWQKYQDLIAGPLDSAITINMTNDLDLKLV